MTKTKGFKYLKDDDTLYLAGEDINSVVVSKLLMGWGDLSYTKVLRSKVFVAGASLLKELASRIAEEKAYSAGLNNIITEDTVQIVELQGKIEDQEKIVGLLREHCKKASVIQVVQGTKIKSLEKDKEYLHDLIEYQKGAIK